MKINIQQRNIKQQLKYIIIPIIVINVLFAFMFSYFQYEKVYQLEQLHQDVEIINDTRKLMSQIDKEMSSTLRYIRNTEDRRAKIKLSRSRSMVNTRLKSIRKKLENIDVEENIFLQKLQTNILSLSKEISVIRNEIDKHEISLDMVVEQYSNLTLTLFESLEKSYLETKDIELSRNIYLYVLLMKHNYLFNSEKNLAMTILKDSNSSQNLKYQLVRIVGQNRAILNLIKGIVEEKFEKHLENSLNSEGLRAINSLVQNMDQSNIDIGYFSQAVKKSEIAFKEFGDFLAQNIFSSINMKIDKQYRLLGITILVLLTIVSVVFITSYIVYDNLRKLIFFNVSKTKSKFLKIVSEFTYEDIDRDKNRNEIKTVLDFVNQFIDTVVLGLRIVKKNFQNIIKLSSKMSSSSDEIINHIYKQNQYISELNEQIKNLFGNIQNSEISFANLQDIFKSSVSNINNFSLDLAYILNQTSNIENHNQEMLQGRDRIVEVLGHVKAELSSSSKLHDEIDEIFIMLDTYKDLLLEQKNYLTTIGNSSKILKENIEKNNNDLNDILGMIVMIVYEIKNISSEIETSIEENREILEESGIILEKNRDIHQYINQLHREILFLDREFNKFRF